VDKFLNIGCAIFLIKAVQYRITNEPLKNSHVYFIISIINLK